MMHADRRSAIARLGGWSLAALCTAVAAAPQGDVRGRLIQEQVYASDAKYGDEVVSGELSMAQGAKRTFTMSTLERDPGGDKRAVVFHQPRDLAGFVSLNHSELLEPDQQWIFLPQLNRTRRLSSRDKTGAFAGSEFSYEDIVRPELDKYAYRSLGTGACDAKQPCEIVENTPLYPYSGYSKQVEAIDMEILQPRRIEYYDLAGKHFKTLEFLDYEKVGRFWRPRRTIMTNVVTGTKSEIRWSGYRFGTGLTDADFAVDRIERWAR